MSENAQDMAQAIGPQMEIDGSTYGLSLWSTSKSFEWLEIITKLAAEPAAHLLSDDWPLATQALLRQLQTGGVPLPDLIKKIIAGSVHVYNAEGGLAVLDAKAYELRFRGKLKEAMLLAGWVLKENLGPFFGESLSIVGVLGQRLLGAWKKGSATTIDLSEAGPLMEQIAEAEQGLRDLVSSSQNPPT